MARRLLAQRCLPLSNYFGDLGRWRLRRRTPGPPPFSSMNSIPAFSSAVLIFCAVVSRPPSNPSAASNRFMVGSEISAAEASFSCDQPTSVRAAFNCLIDTFSIDTAVVHNRY